METITTLKRLITNLATRPLAEEDIQTEADLVKDFGFDSIALVQLIAAIETAFGIEFDDEDMDLTKLTRFGSLYELIAAKLVVVGR